MKISRRGFLKGLAAVPLVAAPSRRGPAVATPKPTDIRIAEVRHGYEDYVYRAPLQVRRPRGGPRHHPQRALPRGDARREERVGTRLDDPRQHVGVPFADDVVRHDARGHEGPRRADRPHHRRSARRPDTRSISRSSSSRSTSAPPRTCRASATLDQPIPKLCTLVVASPFDAALHDAFGKVHGRSAYATYGPDLLTHDLSRYLGPEFKGDRLHRYLLRAAAGAHSALPQRRRTRSARGEGRGEAGRRRPARDAAGMDRLQRHRPDQDQAQRRGPAVGRRADAAHRSHRGGGAGAARGQGLEVLPRLQRALPERGLRPRLPAADPRGDARRLRAHPLRRAADGTRPRRQSRATSCTRRRSCGRWSSTSR